MSVLVFVSMTPLGKGESVSKYVSKVVDVIDRSGQPYVLTPMGTVIEGKNWTDVMKVLKKGFERMRKDCPRISVSIKIDYRKGKVGRISTKTRSIERRLRRKLRTS